MCGHDFKTKYDLQKHKENKKFPCVIKKDEETGKIHCIYCDKPYSESYMPRHRPNCSLNPKNITENKINVTSAPTTMNVSGSNHIINTNTIINNIVNNYYGTLPYGKEDLNHLTLTVFKSIFGSKKVHLIFAKLIGLIHFDINYPQNHNIEGNKKKGSIFDGKKKLD